MGRFLGSDNTSNYAGLGSLIMTIYSQDVADELWSKGYSDIFYKANFDEKTGLYYKGKPSLSDRLASTILGYEIDNELTAVDFKNMINAHEKNKSQIISAKEGFLAKKNNSYYLILYNGNIVNIDSKKTNIIKFEKDSTL